MSTVKVVRGARILTADLYGEPRPKAARPPRFIFFCIFNAILAIFVFWHLNLSVVYFLDKVYISGKYSSSVQSQIVDTNMPNGI